MTRDQTIKVPLVDAPHGLAERAAVGARGHMPDEPFLPRHGRPGRQQRYHDLGQDARVVALRSPGVLLPGGQVKQQVRLDEGARGPVQDDELVPGVAVDVLDVEFQVEFFRDLLLLAPVLPREDVRELDAPQLRVGLALLPQPVRREDLGVWEGFLPLRDEEVVLQVRSGDVLELSAEGVDCLSDFGGEGDR